MGAPVKWGVILAVVVTVFNAIWVLAGMHTSLGAAAGYLAFVTLADIVAVVMALKAGASVNSYGKQVLGGLVLGVVGGVLIFLTSWIMMTLVFPDMVQEQVAGFTEAYRNLPVDEAAREQMISALDNVTPLSSALQGAIGTLATSVVVGIIAGAFLRRKGGVPAGA